ncbi:MarR family winged helix-turn-helix transcriptional regulator [Luteithermobacter gelatinilyticus]|uniref:MarR family winged helix-turn-helix transcriptional regulator n=1 Tax=Luteithermobacter gelatinilyticus TaxID=2582913 RepID=UPI001106719D|nr:MarR family winged helix-turn-helix transcriptional regulator [Luteithermobacter gelatinilyticus]|tara:strand:+ start:10126 stop:10581 length:456 start_codon:yes stop_codon:yes gene_type:complete
MTQDISYRLHESYGYRLSRLSRINEKHFEEAISPIGISRLTWCVLCAVGLEQIVFPSAIAAYLGVEKSIISRLLRDMEKDKLIIKKPHSGDGRATCIELTDKGQSILQKVKRHAAATARHFESKLTKQELAEFYRLIDKLMEGEDTAIPRI